MGKPRLNPEHGYRHQHRQQQRRCRDKKRVSKHKHKHKHQRKHHQYQQQQDLKSHTKKKQTQYLTSINLFENLVKIKTQLVNTSDSVRFFIEFFKQTTFTAFVSATSFEKNEDMHTIDHIIRTVVPWYRIFSTRQYAPRQACIDEYATVFMEQIVKLLFNQGMYVCKMISMSNISCTIDKLELSPLESTLFTNVSAHLSKCGASLKKLPREIVVVKNRLQSILNGCANVAMDDDEVKKRLDLFLRNYNRRSMNSDLFELVFINSPVLCQILLNNTQESAAAAADS